MQRSAVKLFLSALSLTLLVAFSGYSSAGEPINLKKTMKQMRLHYKNALDADSALIFNQNIGEFKKYLKSAQTYDFSPERKDISLEGLNKVERFVDAIPPATTDNLNALQQQLSTVDQLRTEYHKKAKPSIWEMLLNFLK
ncbi:cytochrome b562 [Neptuniibacter marinus]|uniref:cytochrome b562 n=1 Tax=Neptuniibacter marinus TaxID=1806670 RepID=UPI0008299417|nr:cytochrome b562 [Neptuniibacter marinus]